MKRYEWSESGMKRIDGGAFMLASALAALLQERDGLREAVRVLAKSYACHCSHMTIPVGSVGEADDATKANPIAKRAIREAEALLPRRSKP